MNSIITFLLKKLGLSKEVTIHSITAPMQRIVSDLQAFTSQKVEEMRLAEEAALAAQVRADNASAESVKAMSLIGHYEKLMPTF